MSVLNPYDPSKIIMDYDGQISGLAKGVFVKVTRNEDTAKLDVGSDGEGVLTRSKNRSGRIVFTLQMDSEANDTLSAKVALFEAGGGGIGPLIIKDLRGNTLVHAENAWVVKPADIEYSNEGTNREWTIETDSLDIFAGGVA